MGYAVDGRLRLSIRCGEETWPNAVQYIRDTLTGAVKEANVTVQWSWTLRRSKFLKVGIVDYRALYTSFIYFANFVQP